jgi:anaerobic C4-dicarboxylate transporter
MKSKFIEGYVIDEFGNPVTGAFVSVEASTYPTIDIASVTGKNGLFKLILPPGDFSIIASTKTGKTGTKKISKYNHNKSSPTICVHN